MPGRLPACPAQRLGIKRVFNEFYGIFFHILNSIRYSVYTDIIHIDPAPQCTADPGIYTHFYRHIHRRCFCINSQSPPEVVVRFRQRLIYPVSTAVHLALHISPLYCQMNFCTVFHAVGTHIGNDLEFAFAVDNQIGFVRCTTACRTIRVNAQRSSMFHTAGFGTEEFGFAAGTLPGCKRFGLRVKICRIKQLGEIKFSGIFLYFQIAFECQNTTFAVKEKFTEIFCTLFLQFSTGVGDHLVEQLFVFFKHFHRKRFQIIAAAVR